MKFEEALESMRQGKKVKRPSQNHYLQMISLIYYDGDTCREAQILSSKDHILAEDWEIVE